MRKYICFVLCIIICISICGCKSEKYTDYSFDFFDTVTTIVGYENNKETFDKRCEEIKSQLSEYHKLYNIYNVYDGISNLAVCNQCICQKLNRSGCRFKFSPADFIGFSGCFCKYLSVSL